VAVASALHALIVAREMSLRDPGHDPVRMPRYWWTEGVVDLDLGVEDALTGDARTEPGRLCRRIGGDDRRARRRCPPRRGGTQRAVPLCEASSRLTRPKLLPVS